MGLKHLIKSVQNILSDKKERKHITRERMKELLDELDKKQKKLDRKLSEEKNSKKRKDLKLQLKIVSTQQKKGMDLLHEIEKKSH